MLEHKCCSSVLKWRREQVTSGQWRPTSVTLKNPKKTPRKCGFNEIPALIAKVAALTSCIPGFWGMQPCSELENTHLSNCGGVWAGKNPPEQLWWALSWKIPTWAVVGGSEMKNTHLRIVGGSELTNTHLGSFGGSEPCPSPCPVPGWQSQSLCPCSALCWRSWFRKCHLIPLKNSSQWECDPCSVQAEGWGAVLWHHHGTNSVIPWIPCEQASGESWQNLTRAVSLGINLGENI